MTDFMTKLMLVTTAELTAFALTFSFSRPASRETLYIEIFLLTQEIFIGVAGYVVWMRVPIDSLLLGLLSSSLTFGAQLQSHNNRYDFPRH
jgi:hypothetical protein